MKQDSSCSVYLNRYEVKFYFIIFTLGIVYSFYQLHLACAWFDNYKDEYNDFTDGWFWIKRKQDIADHEWAYFFPFMKQLLPWAIGHLFVAQLMKFLRLSTTLRCIWYIFITIIFLWKYFGAFGTLFLLISPCVACLLPQFRSQSIAYAVLLGILVTVEYLRLLKRIHELTELGPSKHYLLTVGFFWMQLRCMSCCIDNIIEDKCFDLVDCLKNFILNIAYCLYLPTLFLGPLILYSKFVEGVNRPFDKWNSIRIRNFLFNSIRFAFWIFVTELGMHFLYCNALEYHPDVVAQLNPWAFYGLGYCMGQYFCNKYIIIYGILGEISRADDIEAPPLPKCIGRIHLYSEMWKHFDRGLYEFLVKYIYVPILKFKIPLKKFVASFLTFVFIWIWHGVQQYIFIWACLNCLGVTIEAIAKSIGNLSGWIKLEKKYLSDRNIRRLNCFIAVPLLAMSAVSNFYFFAGETIGNMFFYRLFHDSFMTIANLFALLYCLCQISTEMKIVDNERRKSH